MAVRFATATGNWSNTAIWDGSTLPLSDDIVYPNGFTVTIDTDVTIASLNNNISPVYLPGMPIPKMTGNTQPSGTINAGSNTTNAFKGFDQDGATVWAGTGVAAVNSTAWLSYQFTSTKIIKRYYIFRTAQNEKPTSWIFQGSNDGSTWTDLETVTANALTTSYLSGILPNTTAFLYYRINVTAVTSGTIANIYQFEMTESTATTYGTVTGGSFTVPATLSGTRNITFTGSGLIGNLINTIISVLHTSGNIVNFNVQSGGYIFNPLWMNGDSLNNPIGMTINSSGIINFNSDIWGCQFLEARNLNGQIQVSSNPVINVNGNIYAAKGSATNTFYLFRFLSTTTNSILNITGNLIGSSFSTASYIIYVESANTTNIIGSLTSDLGYCYYSVSGSVLNIPTGTVTVTNLNSNPAVFMALKTSLLTINSPIINKSNVNAVLAAKIRFYSTGNPYWIFQNTNNADITLAYGSAIGSFPAEADVKLGVTYAASPIRTGTCAVPLPQYVSQGVATGSTVGTAYLNAADVWNILTSTITTPGSVGKLISDNLNATVSSRASQTSVDTANTNINNLPGNTADAVWNEATSGITTVGSIGERLKNASTVQTNGDQLAAYIV